MDGLCIVCGEILSKYDNIDEHLCKGSFEIDSYHGMNATHELYERKVINSSFKEPCFCGGKIITTVAGIENWQVVCSKCEYIWADI